MLMLTRVTPALSQVPGIAVQLGAVGGDGQVAEPVQLSQSLEQPQDVASHQGLAAGDAYLRHAQLAEALADTRNLLEGQQLAAGHELDVFRHAIDAAQVAAVCDGQTHVRDVAAETVYKLVGALAHRGSHRCFSSALSLEI